MLWAGLLFTSFLAGSFFPLGSEAHVLYLLSEGHPFLSILLVASIGNTLGGMTCYFIALYGGRPLIKKVFKYDDEKLDRWEKKLSGKYEWAALFCWLPIVGEIIATVLGLLSEKKSLIFILMFAGKLGRYLILMLLSKGFL